jgi:hypothetical protein
VLRRLVPSAYRPVLANRVFRRLILGFAVSYLGDGMSFVAVDGAGPASDARRLRAGHCGARRRRVRPAAGQAQEPVGRGDSGE